MEKNYQEMSDAELAKIVQAVVEKVTVANGVAVDNANSKEGYSSDYVSMEKAVQPLVDIGIEPSLHVGKIPKDEQDPRLLLEWYAGQLVKTPEIIRSGRMVNATPLLWAAEDYVPKNFSASDAANPSAVIAKARQRTNG